MIYTNLTLDTCIRQQYSTSVEVDLESEMSYMTVSSMDLFQRKYFCKKIKFTLKQMLIKFAYAKGNLFRRRLRTVKFYFFIQIKANTII